MFILAKHFSNFYSVMSMIKQNNQLDVYRMIADPTRRKILELLREQERPVQSLQSHLPITLGAISQHLQLLHRSGLVSRTRRGKQRIYRLEARNLDEIDPACAGIRHVRGVETRPLRALLKNNFALGGVNSSLVVRRYPHD